MTGVKMQRRPVADRIRSLDDSLGNDILDQKSFIRMLCLERKRTERSGRRFVLMLLEWGDLVRPQSSNDALEKVVRSLLNSTRETDVKGWYKEGSIVGVIFTEIGSAEGKIVASALLKRVTDALCGTLTIDEINEIKMSFHVFPDELAEHNPQDPPDLTLYPDQVSGAQERRASRIFKRGFDIFCSAIGLVLLLPLMALIAIAIKSTSRGPILFRQVRVGMYGTRFTFLKFRSMCNGNDENIHRTFVKQFIEGQPVNGSSARQAVFKIQNDPRVTPVGRWLRRTSMDELPQLINVLRGEMSLVGPRPPIPYEYAAYNTWHRRRLLTVKPGITGLWQVAGRSRVNFDEMVRLDLKYAETWSLGLDLEILFRTPAAVWSGDGAY